MSKRMRTGCTTLVWIIAGFWLLAAPASAQPLNPGSLGAALALPYLTTGVGPGERITIASVTNHASTARNLHLIVINGDNWSAIDRNCPLTPNETTWLVFEEIAGGGTQVTYECSDIGQEFPDPSDTNNVMRATGLGDDGILYIAHECQPGQAICAGKAANERTLHDDVLGGDSTVLDFGQGLAFSVEGIHIQGIAGPPGTTGDRFYKFNGAASEYRPFPSLLTTNYIAPDASITAELILFTLDGRVNGGPGINASVSGDAYDDDENPTSGGIDFDCFVVQDITQSPPQGWGTNITREVSGSLVGHLELDVRTALRFDVHELTPFPFGGGDPGAPPNRTRFAPVHGWLVQTMVGGGTFNGGIAPPMASPVLANNAAWARTLNQGTMSLAPLGSDITALDGGAVTDTD